MTTLNVSLYPRHLDLCKISDIFTVTTPKRLTTVIVKSGIPQTLSMSELYNLDLSTKSVTDYLIVRLPRNHLSCAYPKP